LSDVVDHWNALEAYRLEMCGKILRSARITFPNLEAGAGESARKLSFLEEGAGCGEKDAHSSASDPRQCFHPLACDFSVRLGLSKTFAGRVKRD
jgi:hypothetical protein